MDWVKAKCKKIKDKIKRKKTDHKVALVSAIATITETLGRHDARLATLDNRIQSAHESAIAEVQRRDRNSALHYLKLKKMFKDHKAKILEQQMTLEQAKNSAEDAISTNDTVTSLKVGKKAMKKTLKEMKDVPRIIAQIEDQTQALGDINQALAPSNDDPDLETELNSLIEQKEDNNQALAPTDNELSLQKQLKEEAEADSIVEEIAERLLC